MKIKRYDLFITIMIILIVFQSVLEDYLSVFSLFDELLAVFTFAAGIFLRLYNRNYGVKRWEVFFFLMIFIYVALGSFSSAIHGYQNGIISVLALFLAVKWFMLFFGAEQLYLYGILKSVNKISPGILYFVTALMGIWQLLYLLHLPFIYGFSNWDLCAKAVFMFGLLMCNWRKTKCFQLCVIIQWMLILTTGRSKGYGAIAASIFIFIWIIGKEKKVKIGQLVLCGTALVAVAWQKIYFYFIRGAQRGYARATLFMTSFKVAKDYFPFGTGWGTFCSYYTEEFYSPVYYLYGLSEHPELGVTAKRWFIMDAYWPAVIAETGWFGTIAVMGIFILMFLAISKIYKSDIRTYAASLFLFIYLLITTIEETGFMQPVLMCLAIIFAGAFAESDLKVNRCLESKW